MVYTTSGNPGGLEGKPSFSRFNRPPPLLGLPQHISGLTLDSFLGSIGRLEVSRKARCDTHDETGQRESLNSQPSPRVLEPERRRTARAMYSRRRGVGDDVGRCLSKIHVKVQDCEDTGMSTRRSGLWMSYSFHWALLDWIVNCDSDVKKKKMFTIYT